MTVYKNDKFVTVQYYNSKWKFYREGTLTDADDSSQIVSTWKETETGKEFFELVSQLGKLNKNENDKDARFNKGMYLILHYKTNLWDGFKEGKTS